MTTGPDAKSQRKSEQTLVPEPTPSPKNSSLGLSGKPIEGECSRKSICADLGVREFGRILLVVDQLPSRRAITRMFVNSGWNVDAVSSLAAGLNVLADTTPDCAIVNLTLPDGGGAECWWR